MPVLLLARGDQESRLLLRRAIEARYGLGPPAIESLKLDLKGRTRTKFGPVTTWVPLEGIAYCKFPFSIRWNFTTRPAGVALNSSTEAFDGSACRKRRNRDQVTVVNDPEQIKSAQERLWTLSAIFLMPLAEHFVELQAEGEFSLRALHTEIGVSTHLSLHDDHTLDYTATECLNPANGKSQNFTVRLSDGQAVVDGLMLPRKLTLSWDNEAEMELTPVAVETNPTVDDGVFRLESD